MGGTHTLTLRSHTTREINGQAVVATHVTIISREIFLLGCQRRGFEDWTQSLEGKYCEDRGNPVLLFLVVEIPDDV